MADIFISYSSHDRLQALTLAEKLRASGYDTWIDEHHIRGASRWGKEIVQAINASKLVAVLVSSSSLASENVVKELNLAAEKHKHLLPVMLENAELTEEFSYHFAGLQRVEIENTDLILKALEQLNIKSASISGTDFSPSGRTEVRSTTSKDIRLAILPFDDLSKEHDNEWFADGMLDELITTLGALEHMKVPSRTDVMYYKKHHPKAQEIASDLNVRYLVGGSVRKSGEKIRITASMTDAFTNQQIWTNHYDGNFDDIFELQESISKQITEALKLKLSPEEKKIIAQQPTENAEAYELWLRGIHYNRLISRSGYESALQLFAKAIELDPNFSEVYLAIANTCIAYYREWSRAPKWLIKAEESLNKAEQKIMTTARTLWIRGEIAWQKGDFVSAEILLKEAILLEPSYSVLYNALGNVYLKSGRYIDAVEAFSTALDFENDKANFYNLMIALSSSGNKNRLSEVANNAIPFLQKYVDRNPDEAFWKVTYAFTLLWSNHPIEALQEAEALLSQKDLDGVTLYNLGALFDELGQPDRNVQLFRDSIKMGYRDIDAFKNYSFLSVNDIYIKALEGLIAELEGLIKIENLTP